MAQPGNFFFTCKQASEAITQAECESLPFIKKLQLIFHLIICTPCRLFKKQSALITHWLQQQDLTQLEMNQEKKHDIKQRLNQLKY